MTAARNAARSANIDSRSSQERAFRRVVEAGSQLFDVDQVHFLADGQNSAQREQ